MLPVTTNLIVSDMSKSLDFYCDKLGFDIEFGVMNESETHFDGEKRNYNFAVVHKGDWKLMLQTKASFAADLPAFDASRPLGGSFAIYFRDAQPDELYDKLRNEVTILKPPATTWYGMREVYIADPDGYILCFGAIDPSAAPPA